MLRAMGPPSPVDRSGRCDHLAPLPSYDEHLLTITWSPPLQITASKDVFSSCDEKQRFTLMLIVSLTLTGNTITSIVNLRHPDAAKKDSKGTVASFTIPDCSCTHWQPVRITRRCRLRLRTLASLFYLLINSTKEHKDSFIFAENDFQTYCLV